MATDMGDTLCTKAYGIKKKDRQTAGTQKSFDATNFVGANVPVCFLYIKCACLHVWKY